MNFFDNIPNFNGPIQPINNNLINNDINYKINELEQRIKRLDQRISRLEADKSNINSNEPDNSLYMI